jgi:hypothetical protein
MNSVAYRNKMIAEDLHGVAAYGKSSNDDTASQEKV